MPLRSSTTALALRSVPLLALLVYGGLYLLWWRGDVASYQHILASWGISPYRVPFLDLDAILAARRCAAQGLDVFAADPCDVFLRPHVYSPLWLLGAAPGTAVLNLHLQPLGCGFGRLFLGSLWLLPQPRRWSGFAANLVAVFSTMTIYALERGNNDLLIFVLVVASARALQWRRGAGLLGYAGFLLAGLLKFYPLVLGAVALRERPRTAIAIQLTGAALTVAILAPYRAELGELARHLPAGSPYGDLFGASNVPSGLAMMLGPAAPGWCGSAALVVLLLLAGINARRVATTVDARGLDEATRLPLICGLLLLLGCFAAGQSVGYRGILFLLVLPGLARLADGAIAARRRLARTATLVILALMWEEPIRLAVVAWSRHLPAPVQMRAVALFWIGRELLWWWLMAVFAGLLWASARAVWERRGGG